MNYTDYTEPSFFLRQNYGTWCSEVGDPPLTAQQLRFALWVPMQAAYDDRNLVLLSHARVRREFRPCSKEWLSRAVRRMVELDLLRKCQRQGWYMMNPLASWGGKLGSAEYQQAVGTWKAGGVIEKGPASVIEFPPARTA